MSSTDNATKAMCAYLKEINLAEKCCNDDVPAAMDRLTRARIEWEQSRLAVDGIELESRKIIMCQTK